MPTKNFLSQEQLKKLQEAIQESNSPRVRERALILLLSNDGKTYQQISSFIGCSYRTVAYWCTHGDPNDIDSLKDGREKGNYRKATEEYNRLLMEAINKEPFEVGYDKKGWTGERLATYLAHKTGIELSGSSVRRILRDKNMIFSGRIKYRVTKKKTKKCSRVSLVLFHEIIPSY